MKIQKMISLDYETAEIAKRIAIEYYSNGGFSAWVRNELRSYRNKSENNDSILANTTRKVEQKTDWSTAKLLWHLEQCSEDEIKALLGILKNAVE